MAMQAAMLYNLPILYALYAQIAAIYFVLSPFSSLPTFLPLFVSFLLGALTSNLGLFPLGVLTLVAHSIHGVVVAGLRYTVRWKPPKKAETIIIRPIQAIVALVMRYRGWSLRGLVESFVFMGELLAIVLRCAMPLGQESTRKQVLFAAMVLPTLPGIFAGAFTLMVWEQGVSSWWLWLRMVIPIEAVQLWIQEPSEIGPNSFLRIVFGILALVFTTRGLLLQSGNAHRVGNLVSALSVGETMLCMFEHNKND